MPFELTYRHRRLRRSAALRELVSETRLGPADFIAPLFVHGGADGQIPINSMPGVFRYNLSELVHEARELWQLGLRAVALFPVTPPTEKDALGSAALNPDSVLLQAVRELKSAVPEMLLFADVALDPYTTHGHDGVLTADGGEVDNDATLACLAEMAILQARTGVDFVAPSDMMDGRVGAIRRALDGAGFSGTGILAYSAKFASAYYGPFREAVGSAAAAGTRALDKRTYQMDPANPRAALNDALRDETEGADILMVKPAGPYLDIVAELRRATRLPIAAYQVSGEYAQIQAAAQLGWLDLTATRNESLLAIKRAGADLILSYFAKAMAQSFRG